MANASTRASAIKKLPPNVISLDRWRREPRVDTPSVEKDHRDAIHDAIGYAYAFVMPGGVVRFGLVGMDKENVALSLIEPLGRLMDSVGRSAADQFEASLGGC